VPSSNTAQDQEEGGKRRILFCIGLRTRVGGGGKRKKGTLLFKLQEKKYMKMSERGESQNLCSFACFVKIEEKGRVEKKKRSPRRRPGFQKKKQGGSLASGRSQRT